MEISKYKKIIPICASTDENLTFAAATMFISVLEACDKDTFLDFFCFVTEETPNEDCLKIKSIEKNYPNCSVTIINMGNTYLDSVNRHPLVTNACLYKFAIIDKITQYDKVLYLDTDIYVNRDLQELYDIDLKDNYVGAVFNILYYLTKQNYTKILQIPDMESYFNAGVMLMNLKKMREDNILPILESYIGKFPNSVDQHIFNKVCYGKILNIAPKYNVTIKYKEIYETEKKSECFYTQKEIDEAVKNPVIVHYTGRRKPWEYSDIFLAWKWYKCYQKTNFKNEFQRKSILIRKKTIRFFISKHLFLLNLFLQKKFNKNDATYRFFTYCSTVLRKQQPVNLIYVKNLKDSEENNSLLELIQDLKWNNNLTQIIFEQNGKYKQKFKNLNVQLYNLKKLKYPLLNLQKKFKNVIVYGKDSYKRIETLSKYDISFIWLITNKQDFEKFKQKNKAFRNSIDLTQNIFIEEPKEKILNHFK